MRSHRLTGETGPTLTLPKISRQVHSDVEVALKRKAAPLSCRDVLVAGEKAGLPADGLGTGLSVDGAGPCTLESTLKATRHGGRISLMGVLGGFSGPAATPHPLLDTQAEPHIDQALDLDHAEDAYERFGQARHAGKPVIRPSG